MSIASATAPVDATTTCPARDRSRARSTASARFCNESTTPPDEPESSAGSPAADGDPGDSADEGAAGSADALAVAAGALLARVGTDEAVTSRRPRAAGTCGERGARVTLAPWPELRTTVGLAEDDVPGEVGAEVTGAASGGVEELLSAGVGSVADGSALAESVVVGESVTGPDVDVVGESLAVAVSVAGSVAGSVAEAVADSDEVSVADGGSDAVAVEVSVADVDVGDGDSTAAVCAT